MIKKIVKHIFETVAPELWHRFSLYRLTSKNGFKFAIASYHVVDGERTAEKLIEMFKSIGYETELTYHEHLTLHVWRGKMSDNVISVWQHRYDGIMHKDISAACCGWTIYII
jgi:hypothetical protein